MSELLKTSEDGGISGRTSWVPRSEDCHICDVIKTHQDGDLHQLDTAVQNDHGPQYLEQVDDLPCIITLQCVPHPRSVITSLMVVSEARTIEVYSASGDYCGTCRGDPEPTVKHEGATDSRPFYRKHLTLENPTTSCEVKLLSLGGRACVGIAGIHVAVHVLKAKQEEVGTGAGIDLQQVQTMMEEMGTTLSPGAQHLMDMVQFQQKSKADTMAGFLPLLMGSGALSGLTKGSSVFLPHAASRPPPSPSASHSLPPDQRQAAPDNAALTEATAQGDNTGHHLCQAPAPAPAMPPGAALPPTPALPSAGLSQGKLAEVMSALLCAPPGQHCAATPDLLPLLQSVCCQVAQLRMDSAAATNTAAMSQGKAHMANAPLDVHPCCWGLQEVLDKHMQQMEARLREHMDQRMDALEQKLDAVLQQVLHPPTQPS